MSTVEPMISPEMEALKTRLKSTWEAGDYGVFAKYLEPGALEFFDRLDLRPGTRLLDVGCGAGQLTIPAAKRGIKVVGIDLAQNLVDQARERARAEGLDIQIDQGDAEALPFEDASFEVVMSLIGSMFAPRPELVASEMVRVCEQGGKIIMGNWTPEGHIGQMFKVIGKHVPPPAIFPSPLLWGNEEKVRERFGDGVSDLRITRHLYPFRYPFGPAEVVDFFITYYGPTLRAYNSLEGEARTAFRDDLINLWTANNRSTDGSTYVRAEYIEVIGTRA
jgi:SAM-dependent methyltransferase